MFAWGLVMHSLVMALLFGLLQLPEGTVRAIAAWKEIGLALLVLTVFVRSITGRGPTSPIAWPDIWVSGLILTAILFLLLTTGKGWGYWPALGVSLLAVVVAAALVELLVLRKFL